MPENTESEVVTFSADYVKELRDENAATRRKLRELESQTRNKDISLEFARRGINADPTWINIPEGMPVGEAVDQFLSTFKVSQPVEPAANPKEYPAAIVGDKTNVNTPGLPAQGAFGGRTLAEVKADPKARKAVQEHYRELLQAPSYGSEESIFTH